MSALGGLYQSPSWLTHGGMIARSRYRGVKGEVAKAPPA